MKTVIIYATKHGSVENAANKLKSKIPDKVMLVNIMAESPPSLEEFENVVIGGSIYAGKIQKKLIKYIDSHLNELLTKRIGLFICAAQEEKIREKELKDSFPEVLFQHALCKEIFGYEVHFEDMNFIERKLVGAILGHKKSYSELSEEKINQFAHAMAEE